MSGHSHAKTVAATKNANDAKKGRIFSKFGRVITLIAKEKGGDQNNPTLKAAIEKAREFNMPKENIERAIKKGTGELEGGNLEEVAFEALGPGGVAIIIEGITDNTNRTLGEIKGILSQYQGKLAGEGAVRWMFERKGFIEIDTIGKKPEDLELLAIEAGADNIILQETIGYIYTQPEDLEKVKKAFEEKLVKINSATLGWFAKEEVDVDEKSKERLQKLFDALEENDAVQNTYSNLKN